MGGLVDSMKNSVLDALLGASATLMPGTVYLGALLAAPNEDGTGVVEPAGGAYARLAITNNGTNFPAAASGMKSNGVDLTMATATGANWGNITHVGIFDAASGGNLRLKGALDSPRNVLDGDVMKFLATTLKLQAA